MDSSKVKEVRGGTWSGGMSGWVKALSSASLLSYPPLATQVLFPWEGGPSPVQFVVLMPLSARARDRTPLTRPVNQPSTPRLGGRWRGSLRTSTLGDTGQPALPINFSGPGLGEEAGGSPNSCLSRAWCGKTEPTAGREGGNSLGLWRQAGGGLHPDWVLEPAGLLWAHTYSFPSF